MENTGWSLKKAMQMLGISSEEGARYEKILKKH